MASSSSSLFHTLVISVLIVVFMGSCSAQLSTSFYKKSCPKVYSAVESVVKSAISKERRMGASLLRLHFHDCFVNVSFFLNFQSLVTYNFNEKALKI